MGYRVPPISEAKIRGLREVLERDGEVKFKNGSVVRREVAVNELPDAEPGADGEPATLETIRFYVERPAGGIAKYNENEIRSAYGMALRGPQPRAQPTGDPAMFGDNPPF